MIRSWLSRAGELRRELAAIAGEDPRWWLLAGGAAIAEVWPARAGYVASDAEPGTDTFLGYRSPAPADPLRDAIDRARAARAALRDLDGALPDQPLAVTIARRGGAITEPSTLDAAAFAIGPHCVVASLDDPALPHQLAAVARGNAPAPWGGATPFVCVSIGDDPIEVSRHGHRRAWRDGRGPWLGLGRSGDLATVSTCHLAIDGYGHAGVTSRIHAATDRARGGHGHAAHPHHGPLGGHGSLGSHGALGGSLSPSLGHSALPGLPAHWVPPPLAEVPGAIPLGVAWRELTGPSLRALPLAYAVGCLLHRPGERFSPTLQIPVAPGRLDDPERRRRRAMPAVVSVRFGAAASGPLGRDIAEPFAAFEARARDVLERETRGAGLCARLFAAARAAPTPLAWKRRSFSTARPGWLDRFADVLGGRACVSRIRIDGPMPPSCAVSSPSRHASPSDPLGACVVTVVDDGDRAAITVCGSGLTGTSAGAARLLDDILELTAAPAAPRTGTRGATR